MGVEQIQTLVIGGGQAGLVMSHRLKQRGLAHLVLERHRVAERWRTERWDGLMFQFPNWSVGLPEFSFPHTEPDAFATTGEIVQFIEAYAAFVAPPIRCGVAVTRLRRRDGASGFVAETSGGVIEAENIVVATGPYQRVVMPDLLRGHAVFQVHASRYPIPTSFRRARCWWSAPVLPARKSPRSCVGRAAVSISRSARTPACRAATAVAI
jgi:Predicted flavoprotein involved in K+ transport